MQPACHVVRTQMEGSPSGTRVCGLTAKNNGTGASPVWFRGLSFKALGGLGGLISSALGWSVSGLASVSLSAAV